MEERIFDRGGGKGTNFFKNLKVTGTPNAYFLHGIRLPTEGSSLCLLFLRMYSAYSEFCRRVFITLPPTGSSTYISCTTTISTAYQKLNAKTIFHRPDGNGSTSRPNSNTKPPTGNQDNSGENSNFGGAHQGTSRPNTGGSNTNNFNHGSSGSNNFNNQGSNSNNFNNNGGSNNNFNHGTPNPNNFNSGSSSNNFEISNGNFGQGNNNGGTSSSTGGSHVPCGTVSVANPLITNGQKTHHGQWPWHIALYKTEGINLNYLCGGSLISKNKVITGRLWLIIVKIVRMSAGIGERTIRGDMKCPAKSYKRFTNEPFVGYKAKSVYMLSASQIWLPISNSWSPDVRWFVW